jgi:hypothetical protein
VGEDCGKFVEETEAVERLRCGDNEVVRDDEEGLTLEMTGEDDCILITDEVLSVLKELWAMVVAVVLEVISGAVCVGPVPLVEEVGSMVPVGIGEELEETMCALEVMVV